MNFIEKEKFLINAQQRYAPTTYQTYRYWLDDFEKFCLKNNFSIDDQSVSKYLTTIEKDRGTRIEQASKNLIVSVLITYLKYCNASLEIINKINFFRKFAYPKEQKIILNEQNILMLKTVQTEKSDEAYIRNSLIMEFLFESGVRAAELLYLTTGDVLPLLVLKREKCLIVVKGKRDKERTILVYTTWIQKYKNEYYDVYHDGINPKLFLNPRTKTALKYPMLWLSIKQRVHKIIKDEKLKKKIMSTFGLVSPHKFRASFATALLEKGENLLKVQALLGHESAQTTRRYTRIKREELEKVDIPKAE